MADITDVPIFVIIPSRNLKDDLIACVSSLLCSLAVRLRIVVVDNASTDSAPEALRENFGEEVDVICCGENLGFARAVNKGIRFALDAGAEYILILNNDTIVEAHMVENLVQVLRQHPSAGVVGPVIYYHEPADRVWRIGDRQLLSPPFTWQVSQIDLYPIPVDYVTGCAMLVRKQVFETVGVFDEDYKLYFEDADFCARVRSVGFDILVSPAARMWHRVSLSTRLELPQRAYAQTRGRVIFLNRHSRHIFRILANVYIGMRLIASIGQHLVRGNIGLIAPVFQGALSGYAFLLTHWHHASPEMQPYRKSVFDIGHSWGGLIWSVLAGITLVVMALVVWHNRVVLLATARTARYDYLLLAFVPYIIATGAVAIGWHLIMSDLRAQKDLVLNTKVYLYTLAARRLPGTLWYIVGRAVMYKRFGISQRLTSFASGVEVVINIVSGILVGVPALLLSTTMPAAGIAILVIVELVGLLMLHPKVLYKVLAFLHYDLSPGYLTISRVFSWLCAYAVMWVSGGLMAFIVVSAIYSLSISNVLVVCSIWALTGAVSFVVFIMPNNMGVREVALSVMLSSVVPLHIAIATAVLIRLLTTVFDIIFSLTIVFEKDRRFTDIPHRQ